MRRVLAAATAGLLGLAFASPAAAVAGLSAGGDEGLCHESVLVAEGVPAWDEERLVDPGQAATETTYLTVVTVEHQPAVHGTEYEYTDGAVSTWATAAPGEGFTATGESREVLLTAEVPEQTARVVDVEGRPYVAPTYETIHHAEIPAVYENRVVPCEDDAAVTPAAAASAAAAPQAAESQQPPPQAQDKVFVCKYVGTPYVDERLQGGQNPIEVAVTSIPTYEPGMDPADLVGEEFADQQGQSIVIAVSETRGDGQRDEPSITDCPAPRVPEELVPSVSVRDAVCTADLMLVGGSITVGAEAGITYLVTLDGEVVTDLTDLGPGEYLVTASLVDDGAVWGELGAGWEVDESGDAVLLVTISDVPCAAAPVFDPDVTISGPVCLEADDDLVGAVAVTLDNRGSTLDVTFVVSIDDEVDDTIEVAAGERDVLDLRLENAATYEITVRAFSDDAQAVDADAEFTATVEVDCVVGPTTPPVEPVVKPVTPPTTPVVVAPVVTRPLALASTGADGIPWLLATAAGLLGLGGLVLVGSRRRGRSS